MTFIIKLIYEINVIIVFFQVLLNFDPVKQILEIRCQIYNLMNKESDYSDENTSDNENLCSTILQTIQFDHERKETCGNESHEKETKHIHASAIDLLHIRIVNFDWCRCGH